MLRILIEGRKRPKAQVESNSKGQVVSETLQRRARPEWVTDLLTIAATQGFGLAMGCIIYATFVGDQLVYYWSIPGIALGVAAVFFAGRRPRP